MQTPPQVERAGESLGEYCDAGGGGAFGGSMHAQQASAAGTPQQTSQQTSPRHSQQRATPSGGTAAGAGEPPRWSAGSAAAAEAWAEAAPPPLPKAPTIRVQGEEIILETDAASPRGEAGEAGAALEAAWQQQQQQQAGAHNSAAALQQQGGPDPFQQRHSQQYADQLPPGLMTGMQALQEIVPTHRYVSRSTTATGLAQQGSREPTQREAAYAAAAAAMAANGAAGGGSDPIRHHQQQQSRRQRRREEGGLGTGGSSSASGDGLPRVKYQSALVEENVAYISKLQQYSARPDSTERIWRWLEESGPPFDGPPPSLGAPGAPGKSASTRAAAARQQQQQQPGQKRRGGLRACFGCFSGASLHG